MKTLRYRAEALLLYLLFLLFGLLPASWASALGGLIGRSLGPHLAASRKALRHIHAALPDKSRAECDEIIAGMWDNLGRIIAEYPHLHTLSYPEYTQIIGMPHLAEALSNPNGAIFFGAHYGNWEINAPTTLIQCDEAIDITYRPPNNPHADKLLSKARSLGGRITAHAKSRQGGRDMINALKKGRKLGILIDQKYNEGLNVPFFGINAMTNPIFVQLAQKYGASLVPIRNTRLEGARFTLTIYEPLPVLDENGAPRPVEDVIKDAHALLESWIREHPEQWLWLHRRWGIPKRLKTQPQSTENQEQ